MRIAFGTDSSTLMTSTLITWLAEAGHDVEVVADGAAWPQAGRRVGEAVADGRADRGVVCCYTGTGVSIAANKVAGARAALCTDAVTAEGARKWNDANILAFGLRLTSPQVLREMIDAFFTTDAEVSEAANIAALDT